MGFAIKNDINDKLMETPKFVSARIMLVRVPLARGNHATIISAYAPTLDSDNGLKDDFYSSLDETVRHVDKRDKLILAGDFNARVGKDSDIWNPVIGQHGVGKMNSNGLRLLTLCAENDLTITNTIFQMKNKFKTSWMHPRSKQWHLIDYIIVRTNMRREVRTTRAMRGANCWTDHRMILMKINITIRPAIRRQKACRKLNCATLEDPKKKEEYKNALSARLIADEHVQGANVDERWQALSCHLKETGKEILGYEKKKNRDWFDENNSEIKALLKRKNAAHNARIKQPDSQYLSDKFKELSAQAQRKLREMENKWWIDFASQMQDFADTNNVHRFYETMRCAVGPKNRSLTPVKALDGTILKSKIEISERWREHFVLLLNEENGHDATVLQELPLHDQIESLNNTPSTDEIQKALNSLKNNKSPGPDGVQAELLKNGGCVAEERIQALIHQTWTEGKIPQVWKDANLITIYKSKGDKTDCGNSRGISLLSVAGKILAKVLCNRLVEQVGERLIPETQCGFRAERGTCDMLFVARQLQEKCREQHRDLHMAFVDLSKAFDRVPRNMLWKVLERLGCPPHFISMVRQFHEGMQCRVSAAGDLSEPFDVTVGVKQGCVMAPVLFNIYLLCVTFVLHRTVGQAGITMRYRYSRNLFDLRKLKATSRTKEVSFMEMQYADDCAIVAHTHNELQMLIAALNEIYKRFGLKMNAQKTEVMSRNVDTHNNDSGQIMVDSTALENVSDFKYLGSFLSSDCSLDKEINQRIGRAAATYGNLRSRIFENKNIKLSTKISVYAAVCLSILLYGSETWTVYRRHIKKLESYHIRCLQRILGLTWRDRIPHTEILKKANSVSLECSLAQRQLRWLGHVIRMPEDRLPRQVLYGELSQGQRSAGGQCKRYKDNMRATLKKCSIRDDCLESTASDRLQWRRECREGAIHFEGERECHNTELRERRRNVAAAPHDATRGRWTCHMCGRSCASRIGLSSHLAAHSRRSGGQAVVVGTDRPP